ncbi:hypothetical protein VEA_003448 [Vibrio antiquarius]|uniref:Uncharacterized protein n=1 Tax=Vibrio antiquarius (strain Ex25) TaxID=150340 RepID=A0ACA6QMT9_VIBAE|nr:hypothetical protein VEA_003448 [Vibrio antiquarius]
MQAIEIPDNPSPLNFFAIPSHTDFICGLLLRDDWFMAHL